jgi:DNA-binding PadR family transcriptional regulator
MISDSGRELVASRSARRIAALFLVDRLDNQNMVSHIMAMPISRRSSLGLVVLGMLIDEPMHAYRMQKLLKLWGKDKVVNIRRPASIYQTIERLIRLELVTVRKTVQTESHPDRIVYGITAKGRSTLRTWLRETLTTVGAEFPDFPAGVSMLALLTPDDAKAAFEIRAEGIKVALKQLEMDKQGARGVPRLFLLEDSYRSALLEAELTWLLAAISDLANGSLSWDEKWVRSIAAKHQPACQDETVDSAPQADKTASRPTKSRRKPQPNKRAAR